MAVRLEETIEKLLRKHHDQIQEKVALALVGCMSDPVQCERITRNLSSVKCESTHTVPVIGTQSTVSFTLAVQFLATNDIESVTR